MTREDGSFVVSAKAFVAVAQVYDPMRVIAEAAGPMTITPIGGRGPVDASWKSAEASFAFTLGGPERVSLVVDGPDGRGDGRWRAADPGRDGSASRPIRA